MRTTKGVYSVLFEAIFLDPAFWQCLGKAMWWEENYANMTCPNNGYGCGLNTLHGWRRVWHRFIDARAEGKSPDEFFAEVLADK